MSKLWIHVKHHYEGGACILSNGFLESKSGSHALKAITLPNDPLPVSSCVFLCWSKFRYDHN